VSIGQSQEKNRTLLLTNIGQLLTLKPLRGSERPRRKRDLQELGMVQSAAVLCIQGKIAAAGPESQIAGNMKESRIETFDCHGGVVLPGFVDSHTHPAFVSPRLVDFEKRLQGSSYEEIAKAGGGIRSSVEGVRNATNDEISANVLRWLARMQKSGTTTVEAKSGYGLTTESELKSLHGIRCAAKKWPGTVVSTLLGAHVVPSEFKGRADAYVDLVCNEMIPKAAQEKLAEFVDVFCERGAFTLEQTERIFESAFKAGLGTRAHVCQFTPHDLSTLARFKPASYDHLDCLRDKDLEALADQETIATLLPGASYFLSYPYPMARRLIDAGAAVALATDFNPGTSPTTSMPLVLSMACTQMRMTPAEAISAATINGAHALRLARRKGTIEAGKDADLAIFDVKDYRELCYWFGSESCRATVLNGSLAVD